MFLKSLLSIVIYHSKTYLISHKLLLLESFSNGDFNISEYPDSVCSVLIRSCCEVVARRDSDTEFYLSRQSFWWFLLLILCSQL